VQPSLLVWGEQGVLAPVEEARGFLALKQDLDLAILSPAADLPHDERAEEFNELVLAFLERATQKRARGAA
jgi:pimeloyl-ACP methyl ester carboxylesterase